jgi:hypothetical protein
LLNRGRGFFAFSRHAIFFAFDFFAPFHFPQSLKIFFFAISSGKNAAHKTCSLSFKFIFFSPQQNHVYVGLRPRPASGPLSPLGAELRRGLRRAGSLFF